MKRKKGIDVHQKVIIVETHGVSEEFRQKVIRKYPHAVVRVIHDDAVLNEAIANKKLVNHIICMEEVADRADEFTGYWPGSTSEVVKREVEPSSS